MVLALIFGFLTGVSFIVLLAHINKNKKLGLPLINPDTVLSAFLTLVLLFLVLQQYIYAIAIFAAGALAGLYSIRKRRMEIEKETPVITQEPMAVKETETKKTIEEEIKAVKKAIRVKKKTRR